LAYTILDDQAIQQVRLSVAAFHRRAAALVHAKRFAATMEWQESEGLEQLFKVAVDGARHCLGPRDEERERIHQRHSNEQLAANAHLQASRDEVLIRERINRTTEANRVPSIVIDILNALDEQGLSDYYRVIGTHALYAYEAASGVAFDPESTSTRDVDLLWDVQKRMRLVRELQAAGLSMVELLQRVDATFERDEENLEAAMNADGFAVEFLRRQDPGSESYPISDKEGDVYPVQAERAQLFLNSPPFHQVIIGVDGRMAIMRTIDPTIFVEFKLWMCEKEDRPLLKRKRDRRQAQAVKQLLEEGRLLSVVAG